MGRKCSHCGNIGHNSRTCTNYRGNVGIGGLKLFGVRLDVTNYSSNSHSSSSTSTYTSIKKSFSMECLSSSTSSSPSPPSSSLSSARLSSETYSGKASIGYLSDGLFGGVQERKKGVAWTEGEHMAFLVGLKKLGKGDWRGISRSFVTTRTPTQVASHAQKYFLRLASLNKKKRRSSLFDMVGSSQGNSSSNSKLDDQYQDFKPRNVTHHHMSSPLLGLNSSDQLRKFRGFGDSQLPRTSMATDQFFKPNSPDDDDDDDDLELTLGAPRSTTSAPVENKSTSSLLFTRHIRVT